MTNRTKGPWSVFYSSFKQCPPGCENYASVVRTVQDGTATIHYDVAENVGPEDAAFIVEACNSHDALSAENAMLREALTRAQETLRLTWTVLNGETYLQVSGDGDLCRKVDSALRIVRDGDDDASATLAIEGA